MLQARLLVLTTLCLASLCAADPVLTVLDGDTGQPVKSCEPGQRVIGRLLMPPGQTVADFGDRDAIDITFAVTDANGRTYRRSSSFYKDNTYGRDDIDMSSGSMDFIILMDPRHDHTLDNPRQIQEVTSFTQALRGAQTPGSYQAHISTDLADGPEASFTIELSDEEAVATLQEVIDAYETLIPVTTNPDKQRVRFFDGATGEPLETYHPGDHVIARLYTAKGTTLSDLCSQGGGFNVSLKMLAASGTRWARDIRFGPDTPGFDGEATTLDVDLLVDPATFTAQNADQVERLQTLAETLQVVDGPGWYTAVVDVDRGSMFEAHLKCDLSSAEAVERMQAITAAYDQLSVDEAPQPAATKERADGPEPAFLACYDPFTKEDVAAYSPGMTVKMEVAPPGADDQTFAGAYAPGASADAVKLAVRIDAMRDDTRIATWTTHVPGIGGITNCVLHLWVDPSDHETEVWPETEEFRTYIFGMMADPAAYRLEISAQIHAGTVTDIGATQLTWDVSQHGSAWRQTLLALHRQDAAGTRMQQAGMTDPALHAELLALSKERLAGVQVLKLVITSSEWAIERNAKDEITHRTIDVQLACKNSEGACWIEDAAFMQQYTGGESWGKTRTHGGGSNMRPILESNIGQ